MTRAFKMRLQGYFYAQELYDRYGNQVFTLADAIETANWYTEKYGEQWAEVYNGNEGIAWEDLIDVSE